MFGGAYSFDGASAIIVNDCDDLDITGQITISAWIFPTSFAGSDKCIISKDGWTDGYALVIQETSGKIQVWSGAGAGRLVTSNTAVKLNTWTHVVGIYDGSAFKVYLNGIFDKSLTYIADFGPNNFNISIGSNLFDTQYASRNYQGIIDEIYLYKRALSATEIYDAYMESKSRHLDFTKITGQMLGGTAYIDNIKVDKSKITNYIESINTDTAGFGAVSVGAGNVLFTVGDSLFIYIKGDLFQVDLTPKFP